VNSGNLIAGGRFTTADGGSSANYIASWNGFTWSPLGSGMNSWVIALTVYNCNLIAGGNFMLAGGKISPYMATWTKHDLICLDANGDGLVTVDDLQYLIAYYFYYGPPPLSLWSVDANKNGEVDMGDITYLAAYLNGQQPLPCNTTQEGIRLDRSN